MELFLNPDDSRSLRMQLYEQLRAAIADGLLPPGARLPPTRIVADELAVARSTVTDAYERLTAEGYVEGRRGAGSIVLGATAPSPPAARPPTALTPTPVATAIRRYATEPSTHARYDLTAGRVDSSLFPLTEWRRCTNRALARLADSVGHYGEPAGSAQIRAALAVWVAQSRGIAATPEQIVVTHGAAHAIDAIARVLLRPGDVAAVEEPGYPPVAELLHTLGIDVVGVPVDEQGLVVDALPAKARLVHVTPSHQYPLGTTLSRQRRIALLHWAARHDAAIIEDDYDSEFRYSARPLEPLHRLDRDGRVAYVGSFSKILSPALRLGFIVPPIGLVPAITAVRQCIDFGPSPILTETLVQFIEDGHLARHCRRVRKIYAKRHHAVMSALARMGADIHPLPTHAGLHVALLAPDMPDDEVIQLRARRRRMLWSSLRRTYQFSQPQPGAVVGFGAIATPDIPHAIAALGECLR